MKQRLVHSLYTGRCSDKAIEALIYTYTLSALYAKKSGFEIVLHGDKKACELLKFAPYDEVFCDIFKEDAPKNNRVFAWPKFVAMAKEKDGAIHIDGDVFLKRESLQNLICLGESDVIIQNIERSGIYPYMGNWDNETCAFSKCDKPSWMKPSLITMYNCGIIGFKDKDVMKEYHDIYADLLKEYELRGTDIDCVPDLVAEQQMLYDFAKHRGLKVKELLPFEDISGTANKIGYQHLLGASKYNQVEKTKEVLGLLNADLLTKTNDMLQTLKNA